MSTEEAIVWLCLITWACNAIFSKAKPKAPPKPRGLFRTWLALREQTRAKRKVQEDKERRAERRKRKEHQALMRAEKKRDGSLWSILFD